MPTLRTEGEIKETQIIMNIQKAHDDAIRKEEQLRWQPIVREAVKTLEGYLSEHERDYGPSGENDPYFEELGEAYKDLLTLILVKKEEE